MVTGVLAYVVAELALGYTIFAALATIDDPDDFWERQVQIGGGVSITAFVLGVGATGFATWNTHRRTVGRQRDG